MKKLINKLLPVPECGECPCGWEECSYEGECCDCGCVLHKDGEMPGSGFLCRLPKPVKSLIRGGAMDRKRDRAMMEEGSAMAEWNAMQARRCGAMVQAVAEVLPGLCLGQEDAMKLADAYESKLK